MRGAIHTLFGASLTIATCWALGAIVVRRSKATFYQSEESLLALITGSALLSAIVFALGVVGLARKGVFIAVGLLAMLLAFRLGIRSNGHRFPSLTRWGTVLLGISFIALTVMYMARVMPAQMSHDVLMYRLSLFGRMHGFTETLLPPAEPYELLFLFPFVLSQFSAAVFVNFALVVATALLVLCFWRRRGYPVAGVVAAVLTYLAAAARSPESLAFTHVGFPLLLFALLYLFHVWDKPGILTAIAMTLAIVASAYSGWARTIGLSAVLPFASIALGVGISTLPPLIAAACRALGFGIAKSVQLLKAVTHAVVNGIGKLPRLIQAIGHSALVRQCSSAVRSVPWFAWVILAVLSPWIAFYTARSATVLTYFWIETRWPVQSQKTGLENLVPTLCRMGVLGPARIQVEPGVSFLLDPRDLVAFSILRSGNLKWQPEVWDSLSPELTEGAVFLDVGAHIGYFSIKAAHQVGNTGHVLAFEPNPETQPLLRDNIAANRASSVIVEPIACTDREQVLTLYAAPVVNTGASSLARHNADLVGTDPPRPYQVRGRPIDDVVRELKLARVDVIKIDVEGAEVYVLRGAVNTLRRFHPKVVVEMVAEQLAALQTTPADLIAVMHQAGYNRSKPAGTTDWEWTVEKAGASGNQ